MPHLVRVGTQLRLLDLQGFGEVFLGGFQVSTVPLEIAQSLETLGHLEVVGRKACLPQHESPLEKSQCIVI